MDNPKLPDSPRAALEAFIHEIGSSYYVWYDRSVDRLREMTLGLHWAALLTGVFASLLTAFFTQKGVEMPPLLRPVVIILPTVGSLLTGILVQGKLVERYRLRVEGQLAIQSLNNEAREVFASLKSDAEISEYHRSLRQRVDQIEEKQSEGFFDLLRSGK